MDHKQKRSTREPGAWECELARNVDAEPTPQSADYLARLEQAAFVQHEPAAVREYAVRSFIGVW